MYFFPKHICLSSGRWMKFWLLMNLKDFVKMYSFRNFYNNKESNLNIQSNLCVALLVSYLEEDSITDDDDDYDNEI